MANCYISSRRGSNATGTGTAANPYATVGKAIGASPAFAMSGSGVDRVIVEPGSYLESVSLSVSPTGSNPLEIIGDVDGAWFAAGGYSAPSTGTVDWSAWSDDFTGLSSPALDASGKSFVKVAGIKFLGGSAGGSGGSAVRVANGTDWTIQDCILAAGKAGTAGLLVTGAGPGLNLTLDRCDFYPSTSFGSAGVSISAAETAAEYGLGTAVRNCVFWPGPNSSRGIILARTTATGLGKLGGGFAVKNCTFFAQNIAAVFYSGVAIPLAAPIAVDGCQLLACSTGLSSGDASQVVENWNYIWASTERSNVPIGANTSTTARPAVDRGDDRLTGLPLRPMLTPTAGSPLGGFVASGFPPADMSGRARPEGFGSTAAAVGAYERHDTGVRNATYQDSGSTACLELAGPSSQERPVLVDAAPTVISVKVRWDGVHGNGAKPQAVILANPEIGVAGQTVTATSTGGAGATPNAFETLTFASFTPTTKGVVVLRLVSRAAGGGGKAYFDTIGIA